MQRESRPNHRLRRAREARNQTQERVAQGVGELLGHAVDPEYIGRLERGVITWPNSEYRGVFRRYFGVASDADLGFYCRRSTPIPPWEDEDDQMRRRVVLGTLPLVGVGVAGPLAVLVEKAAAERAPIPRRVGAVQVEQVRAMTAQAYDLDERFGGAAVYETLAAQLRWAVRLLDAHIDRWAHTDLHAAVGSLARRAIWAAHDIGLDSAAQRYCEVALHCAEQAGDWSLRAKTFRDLSRISEKSGDGDAALTLAQQGMVRPDRLTPLERATVSAAEAAAHGRRGELDACLAALGRTEDHIAAADPANESPAMVSFFSSAEGGYGTGFGYMAGDALWPLSLRGQAVDDSIQRWRTAADTFPQSFVRVRTKCQARLAALLLRHGDPEEAVSVATACLDEAHTVQSRWLAQDLRALRTAARRHADRPGVAEMQHTLTRTLGQYSALT